MSGKVEVELSGKDAGLLTLFKQQNQLTEQLARKMDRVEASSRRASTAALKGFGGKAVEDLKSYATGLVGVTQGITLLLQGLKNVDQVRAEAGKKITFRPREVGELAQLAKSDKEMTELVAKAEQTQEITGMPLEESAGLVFGAKSAGMMKSLPMFQQLKRFGVVKDVNSLAGQLETLRKAFGVEEAGSGADLLSKATAASSQTSQGIPELLRGMVRPAAAAGKLGLSDEEAFAALTTVTQLTGDANQASTQVDAFFNVLRGKDMKGGTLKEMISKVEAQTAGMSGAEFKKFFGEKEAQKGFEALVQGKDVFDVGLADIRRAERDQDIQQKIGFARRNRGIAVAAEANEARARLELGKKEMGIQRAEQDTQLDRLETRARDAQVPEPLIGAGRKAIEGTRMAEEVGLLNVATGGLADLLPQLKAHERESVDVRVINPENNRVVPRQVPAAGVDSRGAGFW